MKPRIIKTTKILAVALGAAAAAGCATRTAAPLPTVETALPAQSVSVAPEAAAAPPPAPTESPEEKALPGNRLSSKDPALFALRNELADRPRGKPLADAKHFRPLCDADGYPLVGNLNRKTPTYQPSAFCKDLREAGVR